MANLIEQSILKSGKNKEKIQKKFATAKAKYDAKLAELAEQFQLIELEYNVEVGSVDKQIAELIAVCDKMNTPITEDTQLYLMGLETLPVVVLEKKEKKEVEKSDNTSDEVEQ